MAVDFRLTPGWHVPRISFGPAMVAPFGGGARRSHMAASVERIMDKDDRSDKERLKAVELAFGQIEKQFGKGAIMRLGAQECRLEKGSKVREIYGEDVIVERHRHRYEVNNHYLDQLRHAGLVIGGWSADDTLVEVVELPEHPWFVACQFHPEFTSTPRDGHPLFISYIKAALEERSRKGATQ